MVKDRQIYFFAAVMLFINVMLVIAILKIHRSGEPLRIENQQLKRELESCRSELKMQKMINDVPPRKETSESP